jgi:hypothetical protein
MTKHRNVPGPYLLGIVKAKHRRSLRAARPVSPGAVADALLALIKGVTYAFARAADYPRANLLPDFSSRITDAVLAVVRRWQLDPVFSDAVLDTLRVKIRDECLANNKPELHHRLTKIRETLIEGVAYAIKREKNYPSQTELHERLTQIEETARSGVPPTRELIDPDIAALLSNEVQRLEDFLDLARDVRWLADRAADVRDRNPIRRGRGKLYPAPLSGPNALEQCALINAIFTPSKWATSADPRPCGPDGRRARQGDHARNPPHRRDSAAQEGAGHGRPDRGDGVRGGR